MIFDFGKFFEDFGVAALIFARVAMIIIVLPGLDSSFTSSRYRLAIAVLFSLILAPLSLGFSIEALPSPPFYIKHFILECLIGAFIGLCVRSFIFCLQIAGAVIAQSISLSQILGANVATDAQSSISNILVMSGIAILMISGFLESIIIGIHNSYIVLPIGAPTKLSDSLNLVLFVYSNTTEFALTLAAPFLVLAIFYNAILAVVNRAMPQLLVSFIGVPAILIVAIILMAINAELLISHWRDGVAEMLNYFDQ